MYANNCQWFIYTFQLLDYLINLMQIAATPALYNWPTIFLCVFIRYLDMIPIYSLLFIQHDDIGNVSRYFPTKLVPCISITISFVTLVITIGVNLCKGLDLPLVFIFLQ